MSDATDSISREFHGYLQLPSSKLPKAGDIQVERRTDEATSRVDQGQEARDDAEATELRLGRILPRGMRTQHGARAALSCLDVRRQRCCVPKAVGLRRGVCGFVWNCERRTSVG